MGKEKTIIPVFLKPGGLGKYGYKDIVDSSSNKRHKALAKAVKKEGFNPILRRLVVIRTYNKNREHLFKIYDADVKWLQNHRTKLEKSIDRSSTKKSEKKSYKKRSTSKKRTYKKRSTSKKRTYKKRSSSTKKTKSRQKGGRCWKGYEPVPGKKAYSKGSCRKSKSRKSATKSRRGANKGGRKPSAKFERCVMAVKSKQSVSCKKSGYKYDPKSKRKCTNPWAVCSKTVGRYGSGGSRGRKSRRGGRKPSAKFERCVMSVKSKQSASCRKSGYKYDPKSKRKCTNPWAVCNKTVGRYGRGGTRKNKQNGGWSTVRLDKELQRQMLLAELQPYFKPEERAILSILTELSDEENPQNKVLEELLKLNEEKQKRLDLAIQKVKNYKTKTATQEEKGESKKKKSLLKRLSEKVKEKRTSLRNIFTRQSAGKKKSKKHTHKSHKRKRQSKSQKQKNGDKYLERKLKQSRSHSH